jgi:hypothetical protein
MCDERVMKCSFRLKIRRHLQNIIAFLALLNTLLASLQLLILVYYQRPSFTPVQRKITFTTYTLHLPYYGFSQLK